MRKYFGLMTLVAVLCLPLFASAQTVNIDLLERLLALIAGKNRQSAPALMLVGPMIQELSGPTALKVGENGQWTIVVRETNNGALSHRFDWGDGLTNYTLAPLTMFDKGQQVVTFNHTYQRAGTFGIKAVSTNKAGQSASASVVVEVK